MRAHFGIFIPHRTEIYKPMQAFTTWQPQMESVDALDSFVSLEVGLLSEGTVRTKRWINGLVFYYGQRPEHVTFAWPQEWM